MIYRLDILQNNMIQHTQFWYSLHLQAAEAQKNMHICTTLPESSQKIWKLRKDKIK